MKRRRRTEILIKGNEEVAKRLATEIENNYKHEVIQPPESCLVMVKMRETAKKSLFYLGEVLATEAKVQINGKVGIGIVSGNKPELCHHLAVIDAAFNAELKETDNWDYILIEEEERIKEELLKVKDKILMTKVNFETMDV